MKKLKYIIANGNPILFADPVTHYEAATGFNVTSAGFVQISFDFIEENYKVSCYGESVSLNLKSDAENDARQISFMINHF